MHVRSPRVIALLMVLGLSAAAPISAQQFGFGPRPDYDMIVPRFGDADVARLLTTLDTMLAVKRSRPPGRLTPPTRCGISRDICRARLTAEGNARAPPSRSGGGGASREPGARGQGALHGDEAHHWQDGPRHRRRRSRRRAVQAQRLSRQGRLLVFSGEWCGICRTQYPYERFLPGALQRMAVRDRWRRER